MFYRVVGYILPKSKNEFSRSGPQANQYFDYAQLRCLAVMRGSEAHCSKEEFAMKSGYLRTVLLVVPACAAASGNTLVVPTAQATTSGICLAPQRS